MRSFTSRLLMVGLLFGLTGGCSTHSDGELPSGVDQASLERGEVEKVWEEPMADVIDVPPGLDPEGTYYRPSHKEIVEIRQGKWRERRGN